MTTGYVYDTNYSEHTHHESPESALRLKKLFEYLQKSEIFDSLESIKIETIMGFYFRFPYHELR